MTVRALLVYPELPPTYWSMKHALPFIGKKASIPPLGLLTVASLLPADWEVTLVDMNVERLRASAVSGADVVFTSSMIVQRESHERVVRLCNELGTPVVAGGPYPSSGHALIRGVDHFVLGEAEVTLPRFIADFERGHAERVYRDAGRPDLALTPPPRFDLVKRRRYSTMAVQYSRGCPHSCELCDIVELFGRPPRTKGADQLLNELTLLYDAGWRGSVFVVDDNFIGNVREVKTLLPRVAAWQRERGYPFGLFTEATLGLAEDGQLMDQMVSAGFNMVFVGIETPDRQTLESVGKRQNPRSDMLASVRVPLLPGSADVLVLFPGLLEVPREGSARQAPDARRDRDDGGEGAPLLPDDGDRAGGPAPPDARIAALRRIFAGFADARARLEPSRAVRSASPASPDRNTRTAATRTLTPAGRCSR